MNEPAVSVVITSYDYGRYLGEAIESALAQTHRVEVIVVDDGSTDDTPLVAARYPVRYRRQENGGVCRARNLGASLTRSELLMFLDADDVLQPTYVERCATALAASKPNVAFAYTQVECFGDVNKVEDPGEFSVGRLDLGLASASALLRRDAFERVGGFSVSWQAALEDMELWVRMASVGYEGVFVPEPLLRYRRHGSTRNSLDEERVKALRMRLWRTHPNLYWHRLARHPVRWLRAAVLG